MSEGLIAKADGRPPMDCMGSFLTACGSEGPLTLDVDGPEGPGIGRIVVPRPFAIIGRDNRTDVLLDHELVSRRHVFLQMIEGRLFFFDLESRSGTLLGNEGAESGWLLPGQSLGIGPYRVRVGGHEESEGHVVTSSVPQNPLLARSSEANDLPKVVLEFETRPSGHSVWRMSQVLAVLGSSPRCKVRLYDSNVSKLHCALLRTPTGLWVIDLLGRDGVSVNGKSVRYAPLTEGDVLEIGQIVIRPTFDDRHSRGEGTTIWGGGISIGGSSPSLPVRPPTRSWAPPVAQATPNPPSVPAPYDANGEGGAVHPAPYPAMNSGDPALGMLLNHFGQMQQQLSEQFQQQMMVMMQMFSGMHREQMSLVREELDRIRELNEEVRALKMQMAGPPQFRPGAFGPAPNGARPSNGFAPKPSPLPPGPNGVRPMPPRPGPTATPGPESAAANGENPPASGPAPVKPPGGESATANPEIHDWLNDRLTVIQKEQQTRMQRVMGLLGKKR